MGKEPVDAMERPLEPRRIESPRSDLSVIEGDSGLLVFAREVSDDHGDYDSSVVTVVKELREAGADANFEHGQDARRWIGENAVGPIVLDLIISVGGNAAWAVLCAVVRRRRSDRVRVKWTRLTNRQTGQESEWFEADGSGEAVAAALEAVQSAEAGKHPEDEPES